MTGKRYYQKDYDEEYYIFDSKTLSESEFDERVEYEGYDVFGDSLTGSEIIDLLNENGELKKENNELKAILQDMGMLMSDEEIVNIRNEIADKFIKPLFKDNGFNVDVGTSDGFTIIPRGDVE